MNVESVYKAAWTDRVGKAELDDALRTAETRVLRCWSSRSATAPTLSDLRRLVSAEMGVAETATDLVRRRRWERKIQVGLKQLRPGLRVIDCGSGYGTEVIAFALSGADVTAIDLYPGFLNLVRRRCAMYSRVLDVDLMSRVTTVAAHLPRLSLPDRFDLAWSNESIEHITPLQAFFTRLRETLTPDGVAIICNDNAMNPAVLLGVMIDRGSLKATRQQRIDPSTGERIEYANEAIRVPRSVKRMLLEARFQSVSVEFLNVVPARFARGGRALSVSEGAEHLAHLPVARSILATDYALIARR